MSGIYISNWKQEMRKKKQRSVFIQYKDVKSILYRYKLVLFAYVI
jgi:hypothetical protein